MDLEEFARRLETLGCEPARWPAPLAGAAEALLRESGPARAALARHRELAARLDRIPAPDFPGLERKVLERPLPPRPLSPGDRLVGWLLPGQAAGAALLRPALAACLSLLLGAAAGGFHSFGVGAEPDGFESWDDELIMLSFSDLSGNGEPP